MNFDHSLEVITSNVPSGVITLDGTAGAQLPVGTTAQRPTAATGLLRWNTSLSVLEVANAALAWTPLAFSATTLAGYGITDAQPLASILTSISNLATTGIIVRTGAGTTATRTITGTAGRVVITNGDGVAGNPTIDLSTVGTAGTYASVTTDAYGRVTSGSVTQSIATGGTGLSALGTANQILGVNGAGTALEYKTLIGSGIVITHGAGTITLTATGTGSGTVTSVAVTGSTGLTVSGSPITTSGTIGLTLDLGLQNLAAFNTQGLVVATGIDTWASRTLTAGSTKISVTNGDGVGGNPTVDLGAVSINDLSDVVTTGATVGQLLYFNGTDWVPVGGAGAGGGLRIWTGNIAAQSGTSIITPGTAAPLVTDGTQIMSQTVTPLSTGSRFAISMSLSVSASTNNNVHTAALFRGSTFLGGAIQTFASGGNSNSMTFLIVDTPATTSPITYSIRYGTNNNTWYINRRVSENTYGGVQSGWQIQEY